MIHLTSTGQRKLRTGVWTTVIILTVIAIAASILLWPRRLPGAPSHAHQPIARSPVVPDSEAGAPLHAVAKPHIVVQGVRASEWDKSFEDSTDYFAFVSSAALSAYQGDGRAQYRIWEALDFCDGELGVLKLLGAGDAHKALQERLDNPYMPESGKEQQRIRFKRCEGFLTGNAFTSLPSRDGGYPKEYWLDRAMQSGDALAQIQAVSVDLRKLDAPNASKATLENSMEAYETGALSSRDPSALMMLGAVLANPSPLRDTDAAFALQVAACQTGFDCSFSNPHFGFCLPGQSDCYKTGTYEDMLQQGYGAAGYARLYAKAQDIEDLLQRGEADVVVKKYLVMK
jgi:hypothetical protein